MKERIKKQFFILNDMVGVTAAEHDVIRYCKKEVEQYADGIEIMPNGNLIATFESGKSGPRVMIDAHVDEVGLMVRYISPTGFIYFDTVGAISMKVMIARRVIVRGTKGNVYGVVGMPPGHIQTPEEKSSIPTSSQSYIDVGATSRAEVEEMGIGIGSTIVYDSPAVEMYNKDLVTGRCIDNRINVAMMLELSKHMKEMDYVGTVYLVFSTQEEPACLGAAYASNYLRPDYCIVLDTIPAGGTPDVNELRLLVKTNCGPVLSYGDTTVVGTFRTFANKALVDTVRKVADDNEIPLQHVSMYGGGYVTNTSGISRFGSQCPCVAIATPRRYSHSPIELIDMNDCVHSYNLICHMIENNGNVCLDFLR